MDLRDKNILITGSSGFMGTWLRQALDALPASYDQFSLEDGNLLDSDTFTRFSSYDIIFHLASGVPQKSFTEFDEDVAIMKNILTFSRENNSKLIFASTCAVYGNTKEDPVHEESAISPLNDYSKSKADCERLMIESDVRGVILRIFNAYGPGQYEKFIIPVMLRSFEEQDLFLTKGAKRDFIHVRDIAGAFIKAAEADLEKCDIFNIGSGCAYPLETVLDLFSKEFGRTALFTYRDPNPGGETSSFSADIRKAGQVLDWHPAVSLKEGIREIIQNRP